MDLKTVSFQPSRLAAMMLVLLLAGCATPVPPGHYRVMGEDYKPLKSADGFSQEGRASWYGKKFHGRKTANGEIYDMYGRTAAHKTLPLGTHVTVVNLENGKSVQARINDRGPFVHGRIIDLTQTLADELGFLNQGTARVRVSVLGEMPSSSGLTWQVGSFGVKDNADRLASKLRDTFSHARVVEADVSGKTFYRVQAGRYSSSIDAAREQGKLSGLGFGDAVLVALD